MNWKLLLALPVVPLAIAACSGSNSSNPVVVSEPTAPATVLSDGGSSSEVTDASVPTETTSDLTDAASSSDAGTPLNLPVTASAWSDRLADAGLDINKLPALSELTKPQTKAVMHSFTEMLGVTCEGCHVPHDFKASTPKKNVAFKMWDVFARGLETTDGKPVYCDSCHKGSMEVLERSDVVALSAYMKSQFVGNLKRRDGQAHSCATCHGTPFVGGFLDAWETGN